MSVVLKTPNLSRQPRTSNRDEVRASATVMTRENAPMAMLSGTARDMKASNSARDTTERTFSEVINTLDVMIFSDMGHDYALQILI